MTRAQEKEKEMNRREIEIIKQKIFFIKEHSSEIMDKFNSDDNSFYVHFVEYLVDDNSTESILSLSNQEYDINESSLETVIFTTIDKIEEIGFDDNNLVIAESKKIGINLSDKDKNSFQNYIWKWMDTARKLKAKNIPDNSCFILKW